MLETETLGVRVHKVFVATILVDTNLDPLWGQLGEGRVLDTLGARPPASLFQPAPKGRPAYAECLGDRLEAEALVEHGDGGSNVEIHLGAPTVDAVLLGPANACELAW